MKRLPVTALAAAAAENAAFAQDAAVAVAGFRRTSIQGAKCVHDVVEGNRLATLSRRAPERRCGLDRARIRCPGCKDRPLFVQRKVGIVDNVRGVRKRLCGVKQVIELKCVLVPGLDVSAIYRQFSQWFGHDYSSFLGEVAQARWTPGATCTVSQ